MSSLIDSTVSLPVGLGVTNQPINLGEIMMNRVCIYWGVRLFGCAPIGVYVCLGVRLLGFASIGVCIYWGVRLLGCASIGVCIYWGVHLLGRVY